MRIDSRHVGIIVLFACCTAFAAEEKPKPAIEFRIVAEKAGDDTEELEKIRTIDGVLRRETYYLQKTSLLPKAPFESVSVKQQREDYVVVIKFKPESGKAFGQITTKYEGQHIAILAGKRVLHAARIVAPITGGEIILTSSFTEKEASEMAETLKAGITSDN